MKKQFDLKNWITANREQVIESYNDFTNEELFNNISLKNYMLQVFSSMQRNNIRSAKMSESKLPFLMGNVYFNNSKVDATVYATP